MTIFLVIISLSFLILVHELGHFLLAKFFKVRVDEFGIGFPPRLFGKKAGETTYSLNLLPFGGFVKIFGENAEESESSEQARSFNGQHIWKRSLIILAGVFMNVLLGWVMLVIVFMVGIPSHLMISDVALESPAALAGLQSGDIVLSATFGSETLRDPIQTEAFISLVKTAGDGTMSLELLRGRDRSTLFLTGRLQPPEGQGSLGVGLLEIGFPKESFFKSIGHGFTEAMSILWLVAQGFVTLISKIFVTPQILETVTGPVGIFGIASEASSLGFVYLFNLLALISLNLAVLNLIPFPALDGGRFLFLVFEKIKGSPISKRFQLFVNTAGFALLVALMIVVTVQDVGKLLH